LWLLNVVLAAALVLLGHVLQQRWQEAQLREQKILRAKVPPAPAPSMPPRPLVQKLEPTSYVEVAQKVLFSKDRNPDVIPDPPKPPPPPPPVPPFPAAHGVMIWGDVPPMVILSVGKADQQTYRAGDKVGEFEIASITDRQIVFTWDGKTFVKNISDLEAASAAPAAANRQQAANAPPAEAGSPLQTIAPRVGPGQDVSSDGKTRTCDQNDPSPVGAVVDGYRKVAVSNPLAPNAHFCQWQSVN
jgi:hypothetical protein